jgi:hypothetical protein
VGEDTRTGHRFECAASVQPMPWVNLTKITAPTVAEARGLVAAFLAGGAFAQTADAPSVVGGRPDAG